MQTPFDINEYIRTIHESIAEIAANVQMRAVGLGEDDRVMVSLMMGGASIRLAEMRTMLVIAAGGGMNVAPQLALLSNAITEAIVVVEKAMPIGAEHRGEMISIVSAHESLNAARIAGMNLLGHLTAALNKLDRDEQPRTPRLAAVDGTVLPTKSTLG